MKLHHTVLAAAAALILAGTGTGVALAQDTEPRTPSCAEALRLYTAAQAAVDALPEPTIPNPDRAPLDAAAEEKTAAHEAAVAAYFELGANLAEPTHEEGLRLAGRLDDPDVIASLELQASIYARSDAIVAVLAAKAQLDAAAAAQAAEPETVPNPEFDQGTADALVRGRDDARAAADDACQGEPGEPGAPASSTPTPTTTDADLDCIDFPLDDGRTAQDVLDADGSDPHMLDVDGDQVACDMDDNTSGSYSQVDELPVAIDTGRA